MGWLVGCYYIRWYLSSLVKKPADRKMYITPTNIALKMPYAVTSSANDGTVKEHSSPKDISQEDQTPNEITDDLDISQRRCFETNYLIDDSKKLSYWKIAIITPATNISLGSNNLQYLKFSFENLYSGLCLDFWVVWEVGKMFIDILLDHWRRQLIDDHGTPMLLLQSPDVPP